MKVRLALISLLALSSCCQARPLHVPRQAERYEIVDWPELAPADYGDGVLRAATSALPWIGHRVKMRGTCLADPVWHPIYTLSLLPTGATDRDIPFPGTRVYVWLRDGAELPWEASGRPIAVTGIFWVAVVAYPICLRLAPLNR